MQAPDGYEGSFCSLVFPDTPDPEHPRCAFVLTRGKNKGTLCGKAGRRTLPTCKNHMHQYYNTERVYRATCFFADDGTGEMFTAVDMMPRPPLPMLDDDDVPPQSPVTPPAVFALYHPATPVAPTGGPALVRTVNIGSIPMAIERTNECSVCSVTQHPLILPCDHTVCVECMKRITSQTCPMCRVPFEMTQLKRLA